MKPLAIVLMISLGLVSCGAPKKPESSHFDTLQKAALQKRADIFCQGLSQKSKSRLSKPCSRAVSDLWPEIKRLFRNTSFLRQQRGIVFLRKSDKIVSYPVFFEDGAWRADIIGEPGWRQVN